MSAPLGNQNASGSVRSLEWREQARQRRLGVSHSPAVREKIRLANLGRKQSPESKEKNRLAHLGRTPSLEAREKNRQAQLHRPPRSPETLEKLRTNHGPRTHSPETREKVRRARIHRVFTKKLTSIEIALQTEFTRRGLAFAMHRPMFGQFQPDFIFEQKRLVVQADGDYWHNLPGAQERDAFFNETARANGWHVLRFWESEIKKDVTSCGHAVADFIR